MADEKTFIGSHVMKSLNFNFRVALCRIALPRRSQRVVFVYNFNIY
jgi:hypothetical protein